MGIALVAVRAGQDVMNLAGLDDAMFLAYTVTALCGPWRISQLRSVTLSAVIFTSVLSIHSPSTSRFSYTPGSVIDSRGSRLAFWSQPTWPCVPIAADAECGNYRCISMG